MIIDPEKYALSKRLLQCLGDFIPVDDTLALPQPDVFAQDRLLGLCPEPDIFCLHDLAHGGLGALEESVVLAVRQLMVVVDGTNGTQIQPP